MKLKVDDVEVFELSETQKKVLKNDINDDIFTEDVKRRVRYIIEHKYERCFERLKKEWEPKLAAKGVESLPTNRDSFAELVFAQPEYKSKKIRDVEAEAALKSH